MRIITAYRHWWQVLLLSLIIMMGTTSCMVVLKGDSGKQGWNKNTNNPHHFNSTNPGKKHKKH